eukprot:TRINITY_DN3055_c0_g1_i1.p2 TRINITY_DN3055_c0_g1~~TRINITY_DN3055_c0_g1_i1.p2  ORF type:complete len:607 (-),score=250.54 TRINITY_DN3055_c0_g1_i1:114-1934(-)
MAAEEEKGLQNLHAVYPPLPDTARGYGLQVDGNKRNKMFCYCNGRHVIIRSLEDPSRVDMYSEHKVKVNVARFSPNGEWVASGDERGKVIIWALNSKRTKTEVQVNRKVIDLQWSEDGTRVVAVGEGNECLGRVFTWDSGNNVGEIAGHGKTIISCTFKPTRPFRIATAAEDNQVVFHQGPPFKFLCSFQEHTRYPNCIRFSPDGNRCISVGADRQIFVYEAKDGSKINEFGLNAENAHEASILSFSWSPDSRRILTASMDKTCRLWDVETGTVIHVWRFGNTIQDQQVGTLWIDNFALSFGLNGYIHFLDTATGTVTKTLKGHQFNITGLVVDAAHDRIITSDNLGGVVRWETKTSEGEPYAGDAHKAPISGLSLYGELGHFATVGLDDKIRVHPLQDLHFGNESADVGGQPVHVEGGHTTNVAAVSLAQHKLVLVRGDQAVATIDNLDVTSLAFNPTDTELAVGLSNGNVRVYAVGSNTLDLVHTFTCHSEAVSALAYSPDGSTLASACKGRYIFLSDTATRELKNDGWQFHFAAVVGLAWTPSGQTLISVSLDQSIMVWPGLDPQRKQLTKFAHIGGVDRVQAISEAQFVTSGADRCVRIWNI